MRAALVQMTSSDNPEENLASTLAYLDQAAKQGATYVQTPEVTNCVSTSRSHQQKVFWSEAEDPGLKALCAAAKGHGIWLHLGSYAVKTDDPDGRFANRSFLISPQGQITARYDKIHMFDVEISASESYRESDGYRPGAQATLAQMDDVTLGLSICYDVRFARLYRDLAQAGAQILTVPAAFSPVTGAAHWETLLTARAIETGCFVLAAAQTGTHSVQAGKPRTTHGHSMAIAPWGEKLCDAGTEPGVTLIDLDLSQVAKARARVPSLSHDRTYGAPG